VPRHRAKEFISFLKKIDTAVDRALDLHIIVDNYSTHKTKQVPKIRDEILEDAAAVAGKGFSAHFGQCNGWLVSCQPALRAIFCPWAGIFEGFRHRYAGGGSSFGFPRARPAPEITTSPE
jgi:hypothetical protein